MTMLESSSVSMEYFDKGVKYNSMQKSLLSAFVKGVSLKLY